MRKFIISLAAAGAALVVASPAAAQYYPQAQQGYGYNGGYGAQPYGNAYGYNGYNGYGQVQALQARIDRLQNQIRYMGGRGNSARGLREESRSLERRLHKASRNGLNPYEMNDIQRRVARLEQRLQYAGNRYGRGGYGNGYNGYNNGQGYDRDRDGRDDRYENDRGYDRDD
jgi:hypothetical protein